MRIEDTPQPGYWELARYLIGKTLVHNLSTGRLSGCIVEVEGYPPGDAAGHAFRGKTQSNQTLFLGRGYCYVYFTYGSSFMVNVTSEEPGIGAGVLLRALEPLEGIEIMQRFRKVTRTRDIARGPGRLAKPCRSTSDTMGPICVPLDLFGSARQLGQLVLSAAARASD